MPPYPQHLQNGRLQDLVEFVVGGGHGRNLWWEESRGGVGKSREESITGRVQCCFGLADFLSLRK